MLLFHGVKPYCERKPTQGGRPFDPVDLDVIHRDTVEDGPDTLLKLAADSPDLWLTTLRDTEIESNPNIIIRDQAVLDIPLLTKFLNNFGNYPSFKEKIRDSFEALKIPVILSHKHEVRLLQPKGASLEQMEIKAERYYVDQYHPADNDLYPRQLLSPYFRRENLPHWRHPAKEHFIHQLILQAEGTRGRSHENIRNEVFGSEKGLYAGRPEPVTASMACWRAIMGPETMERVGAREDPGDLLSGGWTRTYRSENGRVVALYMLSPTVSTTPTTALLMTLRRLPGILKKIGFRRLISRCLKSAFLIFGFCLFLKQEFSPKLTIESTLHLWNEEAPMGSFPEVVHFSRGRSLRVQGFGECAELMKTGFLLKS